LQSNYKMELKIIKKDVKKLVERTEIYAKAQEKKTPSNIEVQEAIAKELGKEKELIVVKKIKQEYGYNKENILAYAYDSAESLKKFEPKKKEKKEEAK
jgi:ribosomal protein S24E